MTTLRTAAPTAPSAPRAAPRGATAPPPRGQVPRPDFPGKAASTRPFGVTLDRVGKPTEPRSTAPAGLLERARRSPEPSSRERPEPPARARAAPRPADRDGLEPDLSPFRPLPAILGPPVPTTAPTSHATAPRAELARLAEQLVTRLRVGRSREGSLVEMRLSLAGRELDVRIVESADGIELHADGADDSLRRALRDEIARRGLDIAIS